jgi:hypothetical protein
MTTWHHIGDMFHLTRKKWKINKLCPLQQSSLLSFDMFLWLKYWIIFLNGLPTLKNHVFDQIVYMKVLIFKKNWWIFFSFIIFILHLKIHKNTSYNFTFEIYISFSILCNKYYFGHIQNFHLLLNFFEELIKSSFKLLKVSQSSQYYYQVWCTHLVKKI